MTHWPPQQRWPILLTQVGPNSTRTWAPFQCRLPIQHCRHGRPAQRFTSRKRCTKLWSSVVYPNILGAVTIGDALHDICSAAETDNEALPSKLILGFRDVQQTAYYRLERLPGVW